MQLLWCILAPVGGIFLRIHVFHLFVIWFFASTKRTFLENPYLSPHIHCLHVIYTWIWSKYNPEHFTCITTYHLAVSQLPVDGFSCKFVSWTQWTFRIPKMRTLRLELDYIDVTQFGICVFIFRIRSVWKHFLHSNRRNTVYFDVIPPFWDGTAILRWNRHFEMVPPYECRLWNNMEQVRGSDFPAGGFVVCVCVCVCVGILRLLVEGIKLRLFLEPFVLFLEGL